MDEAAKERIMSSEYKKNDGQATDWSKKARSAADKETKKTPMDEGSQREDNVQ